MSVDNLRIVTPWLLSVGLLLLPALLFEMRNLPRAATLPLAGMAYLRRHLDNSAGRVRVYRVAALVLLALLLALAWAGPAVESSQPLLLTDQLARQKNIILAIDVSRSMGGPLEMPDREARFAAYGKGPDAATGETRYAAARDTVYRFVDRFPDARIGLILFSTEPFLARWPTTETDGRFAEVLEEDLQNLSQLRRFSSLTNTGAALLLAKEVIDELETVQGGAVIHISDAEDEFENMGLAIRSLREDGIRLYTFGVGIAESIVARLAGEFAGDPGFRIFRVDSDEEMQEAYQLVAELEESPRYAEEERAYVTDLRWLFALALCVAAVAFVWLLETRLVRSLVLYPARRRQG